MAMTMLHSRVSGVNATSISGLADQVAAATQEMIEALQLAAYGKVRPGMAMTVEVIPFPINPGSSRYFHALVIVGIPGESPVEISGSVRTESGT